MKRELKLVIDYKGCLRLLEDRYKDGNQVVVPKRITICLSKQMTSLEAIHVWFNRLMTIKILEKNGFPKPTSSMQFQRWMRVIVMSSINYLIGFIIVKTNHG